ncbi:MAG: hypothetical protein K9M99_12190 [Candidatus Cloacimonetes bacterium]|nr:hypothetical protein [Candidatus Cloacimonadota bacterium]
MIKMINIVIILSMATILMGFTQPEIEQLRNDSEWIIGKGISASESAADRGAIKDLLSQISMQVAGSFTNMITEENGNVEEYCSLAMETYSSARLDAAERSIFEEGGRYIVYRYIKKSDRDRIFEDREKLIKDYARRGINAEAELRIGDALMNYYWSLVLLRTHPDCDRIAETFYEHNETLITYLPDRIRRIFSLLDLKICNKRYEERDDVTLINLEASFQQKQVRNLDIKYYLGSDWSMPVGVSQGKALLEFMTSSENVMQPVKINVMYNDYYKASHNNDLRKILDEVPCPVFAECRFELYEDDIANAVSTKPEIRLQAVNEDFDVISYEAKINRICEGINSGEENIATDLLTDKGMQCYNEMINYGNARLIENNSLLSADKIDGKVYLRGLPVQFEFPESNRKLSEELVFVFNEDDKIERINFALSEDAIGDILGKVQATETEKYQIVNFIEEYKTAYCTENIDFIEKIFDNNALIIVGQMLEEDNTDIEGMYNKLGKGWKAVKKSKTEYVDHLRTIFARNEYVNLHFEDNQVTRMNSRDSKIFGLQIHQYYYSQNYSDEGYLFLMFDLTKPDSTRIYVRTWQPEKNPDGSIYGLDDFYLPNQD